MVLTGQVAIGGHEDGGVEGVLKGVRKHLDSDVYIGHLLTGNWPGGTALAAFRLIDNILTVENIERGQRFENFEIGFLTFLLANVVFYAGSEVLGAHERLSRLEDAAAEFREIEPIIAPPPLGTKAKVKIEPVDIRDDSVHFALHGFWRILT